MIFLRRYLKELNYNIKKICLKLRKYDIILIGEDHSSSYRIKKEYNLIKMIKPEIILFEGGDIEPKDRILIIKDIENILKTNFKIKEKEKEKPIYLLDEKNLTQIVNELNLSVDGRMKLSITHPVLYHLAKELGISIDQQLMLEDISKKYGIKILNVDDETTRKRQVELLEKACILYEILYITLFSNCKQIEEKLKRINQMARKILRYMDKCNKKREEHMVEVIKKYSNGERPIVVIVGAGHIKNLSRKLHKDDYKIKYIDVALPRSLEEIIHETIKKNCAKVSFRKWTINKNFLYI